MFQPEGVSATPCPLHEVSMKTNSIGETISAHDSLEDLPHMGERVAPACTGVGGERKFVLTKAAPYEALMNEVMACGGEVTP